VYQELLRTEELVPQLDGLVRDGVVDPATAVDRIPIERDETRTALTDRFTQLRDLPAGGPSQAETVDSVVLGYISLEAARDRISQSDIDLSQFDDVLKSDIQSEVDGDMQRALGLGLLSDSQFTELAQFAGLDAETIQLARAGRDLGDVASRRLQDSETETGQTLEGLVGVGEQTAQGLRAAGIDSVTALADANPDTVADALATSPEAAERFVRQARVRVQGGQ